MTANTALYPAERQQRILACLNEYGRASVAELGRLLGVSNVTIRADLQALAAEDLILRTHGGAVLAARARALSLTLRQQQRVPEKERIGSAAAAFVADGEAIFLDASSTALALARNLRQHRDLTVLTHSLVVAQCMLDAPGVTVVVTGGILQRDTISLLDNDSLGILRRYNIKTGFFGAHGLSFPEGLTDVSAGEADVKRSVVAKCVEVVALIDSTKWGRVGPASFARPEELQLVMTDVGAPPDLVEQARRSGARVIRV